MGLGLFSCKSRKQTQLTNISNEMVEAYWANQLNYQYLTLKAKLGFTDRGNTTNVTANFRMLKDSVLWGSFGLLGFEGARILVTADSFKMINRLNNTYLVRSREYLVNYLGFDVELGELQDIMIGNAPFNAQLYTLFSTDSLSVLQAQKGNILNTIGMNSKLQSILSKFSSTEHMQTADFSYGEYKRYSDINLPSTILANVFMGDRYAQLEVDYQSANTDIISQFPFTIPSNFKKI